MLGSKYGSDKKQLVGDKEESSHYHFRAHPLVMLISRIPGGRSTSSCNVHYFVISIESHLVPSWDHTHVCSSNASSMESRPKRTDLTSPQAEILCFSWLQTQQQHEETVTYLQKRCAGRYLETGLPTAWMGPSTHGHTPGISSVRKAWPT